MAQTIKNKKWGRFELESLLGTGGMGDVYKAYDPTLKRYVALKILRHEDHDVVQRFLREARSQARVEHRHVCKIYESGEYEGHPYIAMQYIDGQTLQDFSGQLSCEEKLHIMKEVAMGLHAAHRQGLIHRDVKPANIMIKQSEEGEWIPFVMDFGIAREQEAQGLTGTGMIIGTPFYMSPEHARGRVEELDRRSDIYSMGITLYELLSGRVPFKGDTPMATLMDILEKDPTPIRKINPRIPLDVETIVMKCLEKDPNRRYSSAKELADDLERYLNGDPIQARPVTITYRIKRKLTKHKFSAVVAGVALLLILTLVGLWLSSLHTSSRRARIAQELGQEVEKIESTIRYAHLLPLHNISQEKRLIRQRIAAIQEKIKEVGEIGLGPGHYAVGRGLLALQEYNEAEIHLKQAWDSGYQTPEVACELGRVMGERYLQENEIANRIENKELRDARKKEVDRNFRTPAVSFLQLGARSQNESKEYIEALIAFYEGNFQKALTLIHQAAGQTSFDAPWLYEAKILEGNIYLDLGREKENQQEAMEFYSQAEQAFQQVVQKGESDIRGYMGLVRVLERKFMLALLTKGGEFQPLVDQGIALCQKAHQIDPDIAEIYVIEASLYRWLGRAQMLSGKKPDQAFNLSISSAQEAIKRQPGNFEAYTIIGITNRNKGQYRMDQGFDPTPEFTAAVDHFNQAIRLNPTFVMAYNGMGNVLLQKAQYEMQQGKDSSASLEHAIAQFEKALKINPDLVNIYNGLAGSSWFKGRVLMAQGKDPRPAYLKAVQSLENAIRLSPGFSHYHSNLGFVYMDMARYELDYGLHPLETVNKAIASFKQALKINPKGNELHLGLLSVSGILSKYDYLLGRDSTSRLLEATTYFEQGLEVNPKSYQLFVRMVENSIFQARHLLDKGQSPLDMLEQASRLLQKARLINPNYYEIYVQEGEIALLNAQWSIRKNLDPVAFFIRSELSLKKAEELNPKEIQLFLVRARLFWQKAQWQSSHRQNPLTSINEGLTAIQLALAINSNFAETYALKGVLLKLQADTRNLPQVGPDIFMESQQALTKAIQTNRNLDTLFSRFLKNRNIEK